MKKNLLIILIPLLMTFAVFILFVQAKMSVHAQSTVTKWEPSDLPDFTTSTVHKWSDFPLQVELTSEAGQTLMLDGYYNGLNENGDQVWSVRFALPQTGSWSWRSFSSDPELDGQTGTVMVTDSDQDQQQSNPNYRGHLQISTGERAGRYFQYADQTPFFWLGDTNWFAYSRRSGIDGAKEFVTYLEDRKSKHFTVIQIAYFSLHNVNEGGCTFNDNCTNDPAGNGRFNDLNPAFFDAMDIRMDYMWDMGFVTSGHPSWITEKVISLPDAKNIFRYLLARYSAYNIVWSLSGEYPLGDWTVEEIDELGNFVAAHNAYHLPLSVHPDSLVRFSSSDDFHNSLWLDHNWIQSGQTGKRLYIIAQQVHNDYTRDPVRPVIHSEGYYEQFRPRGASVYQVRFQPYTAFLNGAAGHTYGAEGVWQFHDPNDPQTKVPNNDTPWWEAIHFEGSADMAHVYEFFTGFAWWELEPSRENLRVNGSPPPFGDETNYSFPHMASKSGEIYVIYIPEGNKRNDIDIRSIVNGTYDIEVYDPRTGSFANPGMDEIVVTNGRYQIPGAIYNDDQDWVIKLTNQSILATSTPEPTWTFTPAPTPSITQVPSETPDSSSTPTATTPTPTSPTATITPSVLPTATVALPNTSTPTPPALIGDNPVCTLSKSLNDYLFDFTKFDPNFVRSDMAETHAQLILQIDEEIPAGTYRITLQSFDNHTDYLGQYPDQPYEIWFLRLQHNDRIITTSAPTTDLPGEINYMTEVVNEALVLTEPANRLVAHHAAFPDPAKNSIHPACVLLEPITDGVND